MFFSDLTICYAVFSATKFQITGGCSDSETHHNMGKVGYSWLLSLPKYAAPTLRIPVYGIFQTDLLFQGINAFIISKSERSA